MFGLQKHKHNKTEPTTVLVNPEPKITNVPAGEEEISAAYNHLIDLGADARLANKLINENVDHLVNIYKITELYSKEDVDKKLTELASAIGINVSVLKTLTPSERDGKVYASNITDPEAKAMVYAAFKTGARYNYAISTEYQMFEAAMIVYHTGTNNKHTIDVIQKVIDVVKAG